MLAIGIEGGGTRSTLVVPDAQGGTRFRLDGEALLLDPDEPAARAAPIARLVREAAGRLGVAIPVDALCCALAGAGRPAARDALHAALAGAGLARAVQVVTDADAAFHDAFGAGAGVLVIAGTGSVVRARTSTGEALRVGGWGQVLGDEGSGYAIGVAALRAVTHAADGRSPDTALMAPVLAATSCTAPDQLVRWAAHASKAEIAALARVVFETAGPAAAAIAARAAADLAEQVGAVLARSNDWPVPVPVACAGGLIAPDRPLRALLLRALAGLPHSLDIRADPVDGARGAAGLAELLAAAAANRA